MTTCPQCGAHLNTGAERCEFCGYVTEAGRLAEEQARRQAELDRLRAAADSERVAQQHAQATAALEKDATGALTWSIAGLVTCCAFIPTVVGLAKASGVASRAKVAGVAVPRNGRAAQAVGILSLLAGIGLWGVAVVKGTEADEAAKARAAAITRELGDAPTRPNLAPDTACKLAEYYVTTHGYDGSSGTYANTFSCPGKLTVTGEKAALERFTFKPGSADNAVEVWACLEHGSRWHVTALRADGCGPKAK